MGSREAQGLSPPEGGGAGVTLEQLEVLARVADVEERRGRGWGVQSFIASIIGNHQPLLEIISNH
jgi:hypothetical protein